jgi:hypothetical protein
MPNTTFKSEDKQVKLQNLNWQQRRIQQVLSHHTIFGGHAGYLYVFVHLQV